VCISSEQLHRLVMGNREITLLITKIESECQVQGLTFKDLYVWPVIRCLIVRKLIQSQSKRSTTKRTLWQRAKNLVLTQIRSLWNIGKLRTACSVNLFGPCGHRNIMSDGKLISRHQDTWHDYLNRKGIQVSSWLHGVCKAHPIKQKYPAYSIEAFAQLCRVISKLSKRIDRVHGDLEAILTILEHSKHGVRLTRNEIEFELSYFCRIKDKIKAKLKIIRPKLSIVICFYEMNQMAYIQACNELKIKTSECQHGAQNDMHPMYTHWNNMPEEGYSMLPDEFWVWNKVSYVRLKNWFPEPRFMVFQCGNISRTIKIAEDQNEVYRRRIKSIVGEYEKIILLSLQSWPNIFKSWILEVISRSPENWLWLVRQHPLHRLPESDKRSIFLNRKYECGLEIEYATDIPLDYLLPYVSVNLTGFSSVGLDAARFGVPTVFFHENALHGYRELIKQGIFKYCDNADDMLACLKDNKSLTRELSEIDDTFRGSHTMRMLKKSLSLTPD